MTAKKALFQGLGILGVVAAFALVITLLSVCEEATCNALPAYERAVEWTANGDGRLLGCVESCSDAHCVIALGSRAYRLNCFEGGCYLVVPQ